jgi:cellulose synthase/poly-beta-1,6-N-acetylglucosamine synthase-like glycosyltransferase
VTAVQLPRISIVTPSFNQARFLEACIESVLSQEYPNLEYILMGTVPVNDREEHFLPPIRTENVARPELGGHAVTPGLTTQRE